MATILWRSLIILLFLVFAGFVVLQYNDPDPTLWMALYGVGAVWTGIAAFAPRLLTSSAAGWLLLICLAGTFGGLVYYWPQASGWWLRDVWWYDEEAREGMGMMMLAAAILVVAGQRLLSRQT
jgi:hypothetical protein